MKLLEESLRWGIKHLVKESDTDNNKMGKKKIKT